MQIIIISIYAYVQTRIISIYAYMQTRIILTYAHMQIRIISICYTCANNNDFNICAYANKKDFNIYACANNNNFNICILWRGEQGDCYILRFWRFLASVARDCKRDIYSRFLHLARYTSPSLLIITSLIHVILHYLIIYTSVACLNSAFAL
jgi:hypothetical protein